MERWHEVDAVPATEQEGALGPDGADRPRSERLDERLGEPQVRDRPYDPAPFDEPDAVAGQPRHDLGLRVEDPGVPEVGDEDAAVDAADELIAGVDRVTGALRAGLPGGPPIVEQVARHARRDERPAPQSADRPE